MTSNGGAILSLASDFPRLWGDPNTHPIVNENEWSVFFWKMSTLIRDKEITAHVRFQRRSDNKTLRLPLPLNAWQMRATSSDVVAEVESASE